MKKFKQPFITIENITLRLVDSAGENEETQVVSAYGFTSKFYMYSTFLIFFLAGAITGKLIF